MVGSRAGRWALAFVLGSAAAIVPTAVAAGVSTAAAAYARGPLSTLPGGGAYVDGTTFPANVVNNNYWTDVVFVPAG